MHRSQQARRLGNGTNGVDRDCPPGEPICQAPSGAGRVEQRQQIAQLQQAASAASQQTVAAEPDEDNEAPATEDADELTEGTLTRATRRTAAPPSDNEPTDAALEARNAQRDAAAVARARAEGSLVGSNVDTYA